jgi:hypothetical protein
MMAAPAWHFHVEGIKTGLAKTEARHREFKESYERFSCIIPREKSTYV